MISILQQLVLLASRPQTLPPGVLQLVPANSYTYMCGLRPVASSLLVTRSTQPVHGSASKFACVHYRAAGDFALPLHDAPRMRTYPCGPGFAEMGLLGACAAPSVPGLRLLSHPCISHELFIYVKQSEVLEKLDKTYT